LLEASAFEARFTQRGPMTRYASAIPVWLIVSDAAPLLGAAALAEQGGL
jgi:glucokinase